MLAEFVKWGFVAVSSVLAVLTIYGKLFVFKKKHPSFVSDYCALLGGLLGVYVLSALTLVWFLPQTSAKLIMLGFAISPFLIGLVVTYETEKYFSALQVLLFAIGCAYILY